MTEMEKMMADLVKANQALTETITARFAPPDPKIRAEEEKALVEKVLKGLSDAGIRPVESRKMIWGNADTKAEGAEIVGFNRFLKAVAQKDEAFLRQVKAATGQSEGTAADGGYTVPTEYAAEIVKLERQSSIAESIARVFPMGSLTRNIPRELAKPSVYWTAEGTEPAAMSKGTTEQIVQTAKKLNAIVPFTDELLEDNNVNYDSFISQVVAAEMGRAKDKVAFVGDVSGVSDPFNGVYFTSGVGNVALEGGTLAYGDLVNLLMSPRAPYRGRGHFVLSTTALKKVMRLVDDNGSPIWSMPEAGNPGRILGKAYSESDQIPDTLGTTQTNGSNTAILFGAFDQLWLSPRGGYTVKASDSASNAAGASAFTKDEVWFKFRQRLSITVANPEAFARLVLPAA